jgi:GGDEF domain-containing protein
MTPTVIRKGGEILLNFASTMKTFCCSNDVAARYGGDEFVLVLPETKVKGLSILLS